MNCVNQSSSGLLISSGNIPIITVFLYVMRCHPEERRTSYSRHSFEWIGVKECIYMQWRAFHSFSIEGNKSLIAQIRSFWELYTPSMSNIFSSENKNLIVSSFWKDVRIQFENLFLLALWSSVINGTIRILYGWYPRSFLSIRRTVVREISSSLASFRDDSFFLRFNRFFTFWIICFVRTRRGGPGGADNSILPVRSIILHHLLTVS